MEDIHVLNYRIAIWLNKELWWPKELHFEQVIAVYAYRFLGEGKFIARIRSRPSLTYAELASNRTVTYSLSSTKLHF
jgi:hypothetical protein